MSTVVQTYLVYPKDFLAILQELCDEGRLTSKINEGKVMIIPFKINFNDAWTQLAFSILKSREKAKDDSSLLRCFNELEVTNAWMDFFRYRV